MLTASVVLFTRLGPVTEMKSSAKWERGIGVYNASEELIVLVDGEGLKIKGKIYASYRKAHLGCFVLSSGEL